MPTVQSLSAAERETVVTTNDESDIVTVWTAQRRFITKMRRNPNFTEVRSGSYGTTEWAEFTVPAERWSPLGVRRQNSLTEQQRDEARTRLASVRRGSPKGEPRP